MFLRTLKAQEQNEFTHPKVFKEWRKIVLKEKSEETEIRKYLRQKHIIRSQ